MAARTSRPQTESVAPDTDFVSDDPRRPSGPNFGLQMMMDLTRAQERLSQTVTSLSSTIEKQSEKLDHLHSLRIDLRVQDSKLDRACSDLKEFQDKLEKVHVFSVRASAIIAALVILMPLGIRFLLPPTQPLQSNLTSPMASPPGQPIQSIPPPQRPRGG